ncbi:type I polyketide synthase [Haliangium ochraceum]|uniref:Beta-ketoacyl synthase n=1 Tax=Haliangium ochraceum (strain DSM 14365 / JCM 11303 / SMP-2) TaxID=502025 RepID=D0LQX4_HALO1|nr:type I polyketide synthase [Haliangium ochraceum]ACY15482.1 Beta-ketoacyl synthase [Haliangium ochraceum DSM 14365]
MSTLKRVLNALEQAEETIAAFERRRDEPIAIIGLGCRLPRGRTPDAFWRALDDGVDAVSQIPATRWPQKGALHKARWAALLDDDQATGFDVGFFGISPAEAAAIDPQQRLLLEVAVEALEDAGLPLASVRGARAGMFVGMMTLDYQQMSMARPAERFDMHTATGIGACFSSGRLSHLLGLEGPSVATDTACSSSLVALHMAAHSLRARECELALVGGVNLLLSPKTMHLYVNLHALSPEGRCRTFDARANGFVRGEGCGVLVLKRLSDALRDGDSIRALVRGSAVNHNGASSGLIAPSVPAQRALLSQALEAARVRPEDIGYVEAHGIGTALGDAVEIEALKAVLGGERGDGSRCVLGSVKTNIGHLEAAAGIAGIIKTVLALEHERIPRHLHLETLNPRIDLRGQALDIATTARAWPRGERPRRAGVSAFGLSGTNAHVILEEAPAPAGAEAATDDGRPRVVLVSARSEAGLRALVARYAEHLAAPSAPALADVAHTTATRRSHHPHRLAVVARRSDEVAARLRDWLGGADGPALHAGRAAPAGAAVIFLYAGEAADAGWLDADAGARPEAFEQALARCQEAFAALGCSEPLPALARSPDRGRAELALLAGHIAMTAAWRALGVTPARVVGAGVGEIAAAHAAGALSLEAAAAIAWQRSQGLAAALPAPAAEPERRVPWFSSVSGRRVDGEGPGAEHWAQALDGPARLAEALAQAVGEAPAVVVQSQASAAADAAIAQLPASARVVAIASARAGAPVQQRLHEALAALYVAGGVIDWSRGPQARGRLARLPSYPWTHQRCWIDDGARAGAAGAAAGASSDSARAAEREDGARRASPLLAQRWEPRAEAASPARDERPGGTWLVVGDGGALAERVAAGLRAAGQEVRAWRWPDAAGQGPDAGAAALAEALSALASGDARGVAVCAGAPDAPADADAGAAWQARVAEDCQRLERLAQLVAGQRWRREAPRLWLLTEATQPVPAAAADDDDDGDDADAATLRGAALWGVARTIALELPELRCTRLDLDAGADPARASAELLGEGADEELALRGGVWHVGRLAPVDRAAQRTHRGPARGRPYRIELERAGILDQMRLREFPTPQPGPGQVRVRVIAAGLNFMDVMTAIGIYPGANTGGLEPVVLGGECSGVVDALGPGVDSLAVGDPVVALGRGCFGSHMVTELAYVQPLPAGLDPVLAGGVPIVFLTAWYAMVTLGRLQPGERVLIHSAASGVGLAAVQIAQRLGAEIHATAGTEDKRALLRQMGVASVMDSRSLDFADEVRAATGGEGVDMVLNALSGAAIEASLAALASDGRFLEIGKTDIYDPERALGLAPFRRRISYHAVDLLGMAQERKQRFAALFGEVMAGFAAGELRPLPSARFAAADTLEAFAQMAGGRHSGKLVVVFEGAAPEVERSALPEIDAAASYLITGEADALTLALAEWLAGQGARHLVWLSERGLEAGTHAGAGERLAALRARGVGLRALRGDVGRAAEVAAAVAAAEAAGPLRGVIHAAGAVVGAAPADADADADADAALRASVAGAWHVHRASAAAALDFFVTCSSAAALLGAPGRAREAAAGAALDGLARCRRRRGLAAANLHWGPVADPGAREAAAATGGVFRLAADEPGPALRALLAAERESAGAVRVHGRHLLEYYPHLASGSRFAPLLGGGEDAQAGGDRAWLAGFAAAGEAERPRLIEQRVLDELSEILRRELSRVEPEQPFKSLGVDSLMGLELRNRLEAALGIALSAALLWAYPDMGSLRAYLHERLRGRVAAPALDGAADGDTSDSVSLDDGVQLDENMSPVGVDAAAPAPAPGEPLEQQQAEQFERELAELERLLQ